MDKIHSVMTRWPLTLAASGATRLLSSVRFLHSRTAGLAGSETRGLWQPRGPGHCKECLALLLAVEGGRANTMNGRIERGGTLLDK